MYKQVLLGALNAILHPLTLGLCLGPVEMMVRSNRQQYQLHGAGAVPQPAPSGALLSAGRRLNEAGQFGQFLAFLAVLTDGTHADLCFLLYSGKKLWNRNAIINKLPLERCLSGAAFQDE